MGCGTALVKYSVFLFNLVFVLAGIAFIAVGVVFKIGIDEFTEPLGDFARYVQVVPIVIIVIGCIIFFIAFLGCCGAIRESICMLSTYGVLMLILFLIQVGIGTTAYISYKNASDDVQAEISKGFKAAIDKIGSNQHVNEGIDNIQQKLKCCGAISPKDWNFVPKSCCVDSDKCSTPPLPSEIFNNGCTSKIFDEIDYIVNIVIIVMFTIAAIELAAAIVGFCLTSCIRNNIRRGYY